MKCGACMHSCNAKAMNIGNTHTCSLRQTGVVLQVCVCVCVCVCVQYIIHLHYYWVYTKCLKGIMSERFTFEHEGLCPPDLIYPSKHELIHLWLNMKSHVQYDAYVHAFGCTYKYHQHLHGHQSWSLMVRMSIISLLTLTNDMPHSLTYIRLSAISPPFSPPLPFPPLPSPPLYLPPISSPLLPSPPLSSTLLSPSQVLELLIHRCAHSAHPEFHCIGDIFKRIMECIASGALLSGMPSLVLSALCAYVRT